MARIQRADRGASRKFQMRLALVEPLSPVRCLPHEKVGRSDPAGRAAGLARGERGVGRRAPEELANGCQTASALDTPNRQTSPLSRALFLSVCLPLLSTFSLSLSLTVSPIPISTKTADGESPGTTASVGVGGRHGRTRKWLHPRPGNSSSPRGARPGFSGVVSIHVGLPALGSSSPPPSVGCPSALEARFLATEVKDGRLATWIELGHQTLGLGLIFVRHIAACVRLDRGVGCADRGREAIDV